MKCVARERSDTGRRTVHIIAHAFEQFARLRLNNLTLLLIAAVECKVDELHRVLRDELDLRVSRLHQIKTHANDDHRLLFDKDVDVLLLVS